MGTWLVVTTGDLAHQYDISLPRPPLRDDGTLERWLDAQPEYDPVSQLWMGDTLTAEVYVDRRDGPPRTVSFSVSRRGDLSDAEHDALRERLHVLAQALGGRVWDDDLEDFMA